MPSFFKVAVRVIDGALMARTIVEIAMHLSLQYIRNNPRLFADHAGGAIYLAIWETAAHSITTLATIAGGIGGIYFSYQEELENVCTCPSNKTM